MVGKVAVDVEGGVEIMSAMLLKRTGRTALLLATPYILQEESKLTSGSSGEVIECLY